MIILTDIYFSSFSGKQVEDVIEALQNMHLRIITTGSSSGATVNCKCTELSYNKNLTADSSGKCVFDIPGYGTYIINNSEQYVIDTHKIYQISL